MLKKGTAFVLLASTPTSKTSATLMEIFHNGFFYLVDDNIKEATITDIHLPQEYIKKLILPSNFCDPIFNVRYEVTGIQLNKEILKILDMVNFVGIPKKVAYNTNKGNIIEALKARNKSYRIFN